MAEDSRSLWEQYDSEVEPWRRGRSILATIGLGFLAFQALVVAREIALGNIERLLAFGVGCVLFWLQFYLIWIGIHWIRWLAGAWAGIIGFCWLIWGFGGSSVLMVAFGAVNLLLASYFCLSSSVYFFAKHQRETVRLIEAIAIAAVCLLLLCSISAGLLGLWALRNEQLREAIEFAETAGQEVYIRGDHGWALSHVTQRSLQRDGRVRMGYFFQQTSQGLRSVREISDSRGWIRMRVHFPSQFEWDAYVISRAESANGPAELHFVLWKSEENWEIDHMWWTYLPFP
jgi:hypothetical protein